MSPLLLRIGRSGWSLRTYSCDRPTLQVNVGFDGRVASDDGFGVPVNDHVEPGGGVMDQKLLRILHAAQLLDKRKVLRTWLLTVPFWILV